MLRACIRTEPRLAVIIVTAHVRDEGPGCPGPTGLTEISPAWH
jgi:hypothetical protein